MLGVVMSIAMAEMLKTTEAAAVSRVTLRDVNRTIDEGILPKGLFSLENGRSVAPAACMLIAFYFESAKRLTADERLFAIRSAEPLLQHWSGRANEALLKADWVIRDEFLTIDLAPFVSRVIERLGRLAAARELIESSPDILGGTPVIRGTRVPVHDVAAAVSAGILSAEILEDYPVLTVEMIDLASIYAAANPLRGRARPLLSALPTGTKLVSEHRVERRRRA